MDKPMDKPQSENPKQGKGLRIALAVSLALNFAVIGLVAGAMLHDGPGLRTPVVRDLGFGPYTEALSPEDRKALRRQLFERAPEIRETRRMMRDDTKALLALLRADPFDGPAFAARMQDQHSRMEMQSRLGQSLLEDFILAMPAEERHAFADRLERGLRHGAKDHDRKDREKDEKRDD